MSSAIFIPNFAGHAGCQIIPTTRGPMTPNHGVVLSRGRLATDSIGNFSLTLTNLVIGSRVHIQVTSTGVAVDDIVADAPSETITIPAYSPGSANNDLTIKVRKASATPFYRPYRTQVTALVGSHSIPVEQQLAE